MFVRLSLAIKSYLLTYLIRRRSRVCCGRRLRHLKSVWLRLTVAGRRLRRSLQRTEDWSSYWRTTSLSSMKPMPRFRLSKTKSQAAANFRSVRRKKIAVLSVAVHPLIFLDP